MQALYNYDYDVAQRIEMPVCHGKTNVFVFVSFFSGKNLTVSAAMLRHMTLPLRPAAEE